MKKRVNQNKMNQNKMNQTEKSSLEQLIIWAETASKQSIIDKSNELLKIEKKTTLLK